ncbi:MAG: hypothetical protein KME45_03335 [Stenomitos rutilans HA7619-LM2]|nr:hypothetical protein [Stenomitos rutilans HA7619-LM2]MBW4469418.1 hypothetical protein [Stenomitos rutilans HA7619-LM2]
MRQPTLDVITTISGVGASVSGTLAGFGVAPHMTIPIAGVLGSVFSWFTQKPPTAPTYRPPQGNYAPYEPPQGGQ